MTKHLEWHRNIPPARKYATIFAGRNKHVATLVVNGWTDEELERHANIITTAPELYAALKELLRCSAIPESWASPARAVLAKVKP